MQLVFAPGCPLFMPQHASTQARVMSSLLFDHRHAIIRPSPRDLLGLLAPAVRHMFEDPIKQGYKKAGTTPLGRVREIPDCEQCDPERLADYLALDLKVVVENATSDGEFIAAALSELKPALRAAFRSAKQIDIRQAGGLAEVPKEVRRQVSRRKYAAISGLPIRVVAIIDSDATTPRVPAGAAVKAKDECVAEGADVHILEKRSIENYVPDSTLIEYGRLRADRAQHVHVILELGPAARDVYPMKRGLTAAERDATVDLYNPDIPLAAGLGDFMSDLLSVVLHTIKRDGLRVRDHSQDLQRLIEMLEESI